eukprot:1181887-Prorocentrum_minimum.AAC.2
MKRLVKRAFTDKSIEKARALQTAPLLVIALEDIGAAVYARTCWEVCINVAEAMFKVCKGSEKVLVLDWSLGTKESPLFREYRYGKQIGDILILFVPTSKYMSM